MGSIFDEFTNKYSVTKTLRFKLEPVGKTEEIIRQIKEEKDFESPLAPLILGDEKRAEAYKACKKLIDDLHRAFLSFALSKERISNEDKEAINKLISKFQTLWQENKKDKAIKAVQKELAKRLNSQIVRRLGRIKAVQKELAKRLQKLLNSNAPKFLESLKDQRRILGEKQSEEKEKLKRLEESQKNCKQQIKKCGKSNKEAIEQLRNKKDEIDKDVKRTQDVIKEYSKYLTYKFSEAAKLYDKTENLFSLLRLFYINNDEATESIAKFDRFHSYFVSFNKNRENVYNIEGDGKNANWHFLSTSIANRLFEQNLKFHFSNIEKWKKLEQTLDNHKNIFEDNWNWQTRLNGLEASLRFEADKLFKSESFSDFFSQEGIDFYNGIIGGKPAGEGVSKEQGLNELINLARQQAGKSRQDFPPLAEFHKQILSERDGRFIDFFEKNSALAFEIDRFAEKENSLIKFVQEGSKGQGYPSFNELLDESRQAKNDIYISKEHLRFISVDLTSDWQALENWYLDSFDTQTMKSKHRQRELVTIEELEEKLKEERALDTFYGQRIQPLIGTADAKDKPWLEKNQIDEADILFSYFKAKCNYLICTRNKTLEKYREVSKSLSSKAGLDESPLNAEEKKPIKEYLDASQDLFRFFRNLNIRSEDFGEGEQNHLWQGVIRGFAEKNEISNLYNKTRNFLTRKPFSTGKFKLNFENSTLASGWDVNKEGENAAVLLLKDGQYYLAVMKKSENKLFEYANDEKRRDRIAKLKKDIDEKKTSRLELKNELKNLELLESDGEFYRKVNCKSLTKARANLPHVFFAQRNDFYAPSETLKNNYDEGTHTKGENFNLDHCHELIEFFKSSIKRHPEWNQTFDFKFSATESYQDLMGFYREVESQGYKITFSDISASYINQMVDEGKLYLFRIYNKDFSDNKNLAKRPAKERKDNLHTLYWKALFDEENLKDVVAKLNGGAELFYRKASVPYSQQERDQWHHREKLKAKFGYPILKDKRYSKDTILFHCPITLNFKASGATGFNNGIKLFLRGQIDKVNIIGIDRGERNLLYYSVIDIHGNILEQDSLNTIDNGFIRKGQTEPENVDYHSKLDDKEKNRARARENWETIENIKELKSGYLSQVVHKLARLIVKYNAIVVLEYLNPGFKRERFKIEKQIYQKFERALIDKLNYLVFKDVQGGEAGHHLKAFQLTDKLESLSKLDKQSGILQSGILFYTNASYTSKTDPVTGYVQNLYPKYKDDETSREWFGKFDSIIYSGDHFEFTYDLKNFEGKTGSYEDKKENNEDELSKTKWTICSHIERSQYDKKKRKHISANTNKEMEKLFASNGFRLEAGKDYKDDLCSPALTDKLKDSKFFAKLTAHFSRLLVMRVTESDKAKKEYYTNSRGDRLSRFIHNEDSDFIVSPVEPFYDSRKAASKKRAAKNGRPDLPVDSDANGAYNIARKGIMILNKIKEATPDDKGNLNPELSINKTDWQNYCQDRAITDKQREKYRQLLNEGNEG